MYCREWVLICKFLFRIKIWNGRQWAWMKMHRTLLYSGVKVVLSAREWSKTGKASLKLADSKASISISTQSTERIILSLWRSKAFINTQPLDSFKWAKSTLIFRFKIRVLILMRIVSWTSFPKMEWTRNPNSNLKNKSQSL